jgi:hypothetical protein
MAGKVATIIGLEIAKHYTERAIYKALRAAGNGNDIRVQPVPGSDLGYLVVHNKRSKAEAEKCLLAVLGAYKGFGGREFDITDLPTNAPEPAIAGLTNENAKEPASHEEIYGAKSEWVVNPDLHKVSRKFDRANK